LLSENYHSQTASTIGSENEVLTTVAITGTVWVASLGAYHYFGQEHSVVQQWRTRFGWFTQRSAAPQPADTPVNIDLNSAAQEAPQLELMQWQTSQQCTNERLLAASLSLSLATAGAVLIPPITYTCLPALTYLTFHVAQGAYQTLTKERRLDRTLFESLLIGCSLVHGDYLVGSAVCLLYYGGRKVRVIRELPLVGQPPLSKTLVGTNAFAVQARVQRAGNECKVPVATLQHGDTVVVRAGELIPMAGQISGGRAWVALQNSSQNAQVVIKRPGDQVYANQLVLAGLLYIVVQPAELS
jgi:hypothetical protein